MLPARRHEITRVEAFSDAMPYPAFSGFTYFLMGPAHWIYGARVGRRRKEMLAGSTAGDAAAIT